MWLTATTGRSHNSILSAWLKVPLTWYQSVTVSYFPDERHEHIARTFAPDERPGSQRKFCGFCGTHISYWTEDPVSEQDYMNVTLGSLRRRDILALEDLDLLPEDVTLGRVVVPETEDTRVVARDISSEEQAMTQSSDGGTVRTSRSGTSGGISWFEDMIEGSQLGNHSKRRKGHGRSADGSTAISWEVSEYYEGDEETEQPTAGSKRKADNIEPDDTKMGD